MTDEIRANGGRAIASVGDVSDVHAMDRVASDALRHVMQSSAYTTAALSNATRIISFAAAGLALAAGLRRWRNAA